MAHSQSAASWAWKSVLSGIPRTHGGRSGASFHSLIFTTQTFMGLIQSCVYMPSFIHLQIFKQNARSTAGTGTSEEDPNAQRAVTPRPCLLRVCAVLRWARGGHVAVHPPGGPADPTLRQDPRSPPTGAGFWSGWGGRGEGEAALRLCARRCPLTAPPRGPAAGSPGP